VAVKENRKPRRGSAPATTCTVVRDNAYSV
jgi:hypothetical protein